MKGSIQRAPLVTVLGWIVRVRLMLTSPVAYGIVADSTFMGYEGGVFGAIGENSANHAVDTIGQAHTTDSDKWGSWAPLQVGSRGP